MKQIAKRLELIKTAISIEDEEIIELQVMKLNMLDCDGEVLNILERVENKDYGRVVLEIESYLKKFSGIVLYEDTELQGLRLELKVLEEKLQDFNTQKDEYLNDINEFNVEYHLHLGELIHKILLIKEEKLLASLKKMEEDYETSTQEYSELMEVYTEFKRDSQEFNEENKEIISEDRKELDEEEKKELKKLFRRASKLCHPDLVSDDLREKATEIMKELNDAYSKRDINKVRDILSSLESGNDFKVFSDTIEDKGLLKSKIVEIKEMLKQREEELQEIKDDEVVKIMSEHKDLKVYFEELKKQLEEEYENLKNEL